ncbi:hypothetical protein MHYP_G00350980 [Metynnis hypsauchen]
MKWSFDKRAVARQFQPGDKVMVLLPVPGPSLSAKFSGPYSVEEKLSDTDYIIPTPDRKRKKRVCHINMLKTYHTRTAEDALSDKQEQPEDDLVVYTSDWPTHVKILSPVFERLAKASLTLNLAKCEFAQATVTYLDCGAPRSRSCRVSVVVQEEGSAFAAALTETSRRGVFLADCGESSCSAGLVSALMAAGGNQKPGQSWTIWTSGITCKQICTGDNMALEQVTGQDLDAELNEEEELEEKEDSNEDDCAGK